MGIEPRPLANRVNITPLDYQDTDTLPVMLKRHFSISLYLSHFSNAKLTTAADV